MAKLFKKSDLPHFDSTRDGRDRLDLAKPDTPVPQPAIWSDRVLYHPGDTCAKHYHLDAHHLFVMLAGETELHTPEGMVPFKPGMIAAIAPEEVHWFENNTNQNAHFVEFWAPPPSDTVWIIEDDV